MSLIERYMLFCAVILIVAPIFLSTISSDNITASDWIYRHSVWIGKYIEGDFSPVLDYPPLFHLMMLPFVAVGFAMKYFQIIFAVLSSTAILYMAYKLEDSKSALYFAVLLASSIAYVEFAGSLMPQALDYLFFGLSLVFYYKKEVNKTLIFLALDFLLHGVGFMFLLILLAHSLITKNKKFIIPLFLLFVILSPIFYYYTFIASYNVEYKWDMESQMEWETRFLTPFYNFFIFSGFLTWVLLPYSCYKIYKEKYILSDTQSLYIIWILMFLAFIPFNIGVWRMISYQIVPLSLFIASILSEKNERQEPRKFQKGCQKYFGIER